MKTQEQKMGRVKVQVEIANFSDMTAVEEGRLEADRIRRVSVEAVIDPGATRLVLPESLVKAMGFHDFKTKTKVIYADGRKALRREVGGVFLSLQGRSGLYLAIVEPKRTTALIGAIVLEDLDFLVDCKKQRLVPRDPDYVLSEVE